MKTMTCKQLGGPCDFPHQDGNERGFGGAPLPGMTAQKTHDENDGEHQKRCLDQQQDCDHGQIPYRRARRVALAPHAAAATWPQRL
jgi:hypothetical protein